MLFLSLLVETGQRPGAGLTQADKTIIQLNFYLEILKGRNLGFKRRQKPPLPPPLNATLDTQTYTHTHTRDNYSNRRCAHAHRGLIIMTDEHDEIQHHFFLLTGGCDIPATPVIGQLTGFISSQVGAQVTYECPATSSSVVATCTENLVWDPASSVTHCGKFN